MTDKKVTPPLGAFPGAPPQPQAPFLPGPPHQAAPQYGANYSTQHYGCPVAGASPYGVAFSGGGAGGGGAGGGGYPPPPQSAAVAAYDQALAAAAAAAASAAMHHPQHHPPPPMPHQMYSPAAAMYAASYPGYMSYPVQYYPYYPATAVQPSIQPLRPTIMIPNGFEASGRLEGVAPPLLPPAPPHHLAAMATHQSPEYYDAKYSQQRFFN